MENCLSSGLKAAISGITHAQLADKSFVSRRRSKFVGHTPPACSAYIAFLDPHAGGIQVFAAPTAAESMTNVPEASLSSAL